MATPVTTAASPSVAQPLAEPLSSGSARMRRESKIHTLPHDVAVVADRSTEAFMKMMEAMQAELAATNRDLAAVRATLAESQARYAALATATKARSAAQMVSTAAAIKRLGAVTGELEALKLATAPIIAEHLAPPPLPTRQCPVFSNGRFTGDYYSQTLINGEWKSYYNGAWR